MQKNKKWKKLIGFIVVSYGLFWILLAATGLLISMDIPVFWQNFLKNFIAWSPTFAVLILFKSLYPHTTLKEYFKRHFLTPIKVRPFILSFLLQLGCLGIVIGIYLAFFGQTFNSLSFLPISSLLPLAIITATSGPIGEELGWRGYALNRLEKDLSPLLSSIILGLVWGLWHLPLWFLSGFSGVNLLIYILAFVLGIVATSILITFFYHRCNNILMAMWIHFWFNFLLKLVNIDLLFLLVCIVGAYSIIALLIVIFNQNEFLKTSVKYMNSD